MKLWAISDLHVGYEENRRAVQALPSYPDDWLIIAGDTGETPAHLDFVLRTLQPRFAQLIWTPGNHDLWTPRHAAEPSSAASPHYERLVVALPQVRRADAGRSVRAWPGDGPTRAIVPTFLLFDYSFRPASVTREEAVAWAARDRRAIGRRGSARAGSVSDPRRLVRRARRGDRSAPRRAAAGREADRREPLSAAAGPGRAAAHSALLDLVRHDEDRTTGIAASTSRRSVYGHLHLRSSKDDRRRALRRSVAGISEAVEPAEDARGLLAADSLDSFRRREAADVDEVLRRRRPSSGTCAHASDAAASVINLPSGEYDAYSQSPFLSAP